MLPNSRWLRANGFSGLDHVLHTRPELFAHLIQDRIRVRAVSDWVVVAEKMAKNNAGQLPSSGWLRLHGHDGLRQALRKQPELFAHIPQARKRQKRKAEQWVPVAEKLAKKHGKLPNRKWLRCHGYSGLDTCLCRHPHQFDHIQQLHLQRNGHPVK